MPLSAKATDAYGRSAGQSCRFSWMQPRDREILFTHVTEAISGRLQLGHSNLQQEMRLSCRYWNTT